MDEPSGHCYLFLHLIVLWDSLSEVPSVKWMWMCVWVCILIHTHAHIYSGAEKDRQFHMLIKYFYNEQIKSNGSPQNNVLLIILLKAFTTWRCIDYHTVELGLHYTAANAESSGFIKILEHREAWVVLLQFLKNVLSLKHHRLVRTPQQFLLPPTVQLRLAWSLDQVI